MNSVTLYPALYFTLIAACLKEPGSLVMMLTSALIFRGKEMPRQTGENYERLEHRAPYLHTEQNILRICK